MSKALKWTWLPRLAGLGLLGYLIIRVDARLLVDGLRGADAPRVAAAVCGLGPLIGLKTLRWQRLLKAHGIAYRTAPAFLAYFASLGVGYLTPGRLGEFVKALYVSRACAVSPTRAFAGVLADRLFDLYALMVVGGLGLIRLTDAHPLWLGALILVMPAALFGLLADPPYAALQRLAGRWGHIGRRVAGNEGMLTTLRAGLRELGWSAAFTAGWLTIAAYALFFAQCFVLARAVGLPIGFSTVMVAVALGSLVTLLPFSVAGLGTREATLILCLGAAGVAPEAAMSFSLLVFFTFQVAVAVIGAAAWMVYPLPLGAIHAPPGP